MEFIALGCLLLTAAILPLRYVGLCRLLEKDDQESWCLLGKPKGHGFFDLGKTFAVNAWVLSKGYESSISEDVRSQGKSCFHRAMILRRLLWFALVSLFLGCVLSLAELRLIL